VDDVDTLQWRLGSTAVREPLRLEACVTLASGKAIMKRFLVGVLTILATSSSVRANLGDRDDTVEDAYEKIIERHLGDDGKVSVVYHKDRYLYLVIFENGRSISETYSHAKRTPLTKKEIARFLKANAGGATWIPADRPGERRFERSDHRAEATYAATDQGPALTVRILKKR
jgi:hypothetical protein